MNDSPVYLFTPSGEPAWMVSGWYTPKPPVPPTWWQRVRRVIAAWLYRLADWVTA